MFTYHHPCYPPRINQSILSKFARAHPLVDENTVVHEHSHAEIGMQDYGADVDDEDDQMNVSPLDYRPPGHLSTFFVCCRCYATLSVSMLN